MIIEKFAPVLIPTLNRYDHLRRCLDSLAQNTHADKTHLYIALDAPSKEEHWEGYNKIVEYIKEIKGFKEITVIKRDTNFGAIKNIYGSVNELFEKYDEIIFSEDDNFFSPNFLDYTNKGLQLFKDRKDILAVCGYNYLIDVPKKYPHNFYIGKACPFWGVGLWKEKYENIELSVNSVGEFLKNYKNVLKVINSANHLLPLLFDIVEKNHIAGDVIFTMNLIKNNMFCVLPIISKVRNYGNDGTGVHCTIDRENILINQNIDDANFFDFSNSAKIIYNKELANRLFKKARISNARVFERIMLFLTRNTAPNRYYVRLKKSIKTFLKK